jgi:hypothetical protein
MNDKVLICGGLDASGVLGSVELYTVASKSFTAAGSMNVPRWLHTATFLNDGTALIVGGSSLANQAALNSAEIYDPVVGSFTLLSSTLNTARVGQTATLLPNGQVLIVGGYDPNSGIISDAELYDPTAQIFIDLGDTSTPRFHHTTTLLQNGQVLLNGRRDGSHPDRCLQHRRNLQSLDLDVHASNGEYDHRPRRSHCIAFEQWAGPDHGAAICLGQAR